MPPDSRRLLDLVQAAFAQTNPIARQQSLDGACPVDDALRPRLDELLRVADELAAAFGHPPDLAALVADLAERSTSLDSLSPDSDLPDDSAGLERPAAEVDPMLGLEVAERYRIRRVLGEGGMGVVYLAEQVRPVRRLVALKLIRAGMDTRRVLTRFEGERQALALMDHPHIARVLDAGSTGPGRPFFVMDLVRGVPLTDFADAHRLDLPARLGLFGEVCLAVQHAHQKGVIHRDLKPSNILVENREGRGVPKVIDFGLAKATSGLHLTDASIDTAFGVVAGTPLYMAPEQATFQLADVDTRADIYALGVILYELLTGSTPIRQASLTTTPLDEFFRAVREEEPPTPSQRVSSADDLTAVASNRHVEPSRLGRLLRGELDWIVMKALAKERERRYDSAAALAADLGRYLRHEPVVAGPPSAGYRMRKFVRRHRGQVVAAALVVLTLLGGIVGTTLGLLEARNQARVAREQTEVARAGSVAKGKALVGEAAQRRRAEQRLGQIEQINGVLASLFENIDPDNAEDDPRTLADLLADRLDEAARLVDGDAIGDPAAVARLQLTLGQSMLGVGRYREAIDLLGRCHATLRDQAGPTAPDTLVAQCSLALAHNKAGQADRARLLYDEALRTIDSRFDFADPAILDLVQRLDWLLDRDHFIAATPLVERGLAAQRPRLGAEHPEILATTLVLASSYMETERVEQALPLLERVHEARRARLGADHPDTVRTLGQLAHAQIHLDHPERAVPLLEQAVAHYRARLGPDHPSTIGGLKQLIRALRDSDQLARAAALADEVTPLVRTRFGPDHPETLTALQSAAALTRQIQPERAIPLYEQLVILRRARLGANHPETLETRLGLAATHQAVDQFDQAIAIIEDVLAIRRAELGEKAIPTLESMSLLGVAWRHAGRHGPAITLLEEVLARHRARPEPDQRKILTVMGLLAMALKDDGQLDRAISLLEEALAGERAFLGAGHPDVFVTLYNLGLVLLDAGRWDHAIAAFEGTLAAEEARLGVGHPETGSTLHHLANALARSHQHARAIPFYERAQSVRAAHLGADDPQTLTTMFELAEALREVREFDRAVAIFERLLPLRRAKLGSDHIDVFETLLGMGEALVGARQHERAVARLDEALSLGRTQLDWDHPTMLYAMGHLGHALRGAGQHDRAIRTYGQALTLYEARHEPDHPNCQTSRDNLILGYQAAGQFDRVVAVRERAVGVLAERRPSDHPDVLSARNWLGLAHRDAGQVEQAVPLFEAVLAGRRATLPADHPQRLNSLSNLGLILHDVGRFAEAEPPLVELVAARRRVDGPDAPATGHALSLLGTVVLHQGRAAEAEPLLRASLAIRERHEPDLWSTSNNRSILGASLLDQGRLAEARPLLRAGFEGLKVHRREVPQASRLRPIDALDRLIRLAEATDQPDEAQTWRDERSRWLATLARPASVADPRSQLPNRP